MPADLLFLSTVSCAKPSPGPETASQNAADAKVAWFEGSPDEAFAFARAEGRLNLLSWRHSGFSAHGAVRVEDRQGAVRLGRYMIRCPIVLKRLRWHEETGEVVCWGRPSRRGRRDRSRARWDVLEFLARVVDHVPEPSQQTVRYWGYYANAARGRRRKAALGERRDADAGPPGRR